MKKQVKIIIVCILYNFIRDNHKNNDLFDMCDEDEDFVLNDKNVSSSHSQLYGQEKSDMNDLCDNIADDLMTVYQ
jgi:hypothetical protein